MKMPIDKEWFEKRAAAEGDLEISAGSRKLTMTLNLTDEEIATLERVAFDGLPIWARERIEQLECENAELREALEPFAKVADELTPSKYGPAWGFNNAIIEHEDFRRARRLIDTEAQRD